MQIFKTSIWILLLAVTSACGGGGGGGSNPPAPDPAGSSGAGGAVASSDLVKGTITGFGSVYIDGKRFDTSTASFSKDDQPATQDDLRVGMLVKVRGDIQAGTADSVSFDEDVKGPVDAINGDELTVLGQTVRVMPDTVLDNNLDLTTLLVGDVLEVSGLRGENDVLEASFIERKDPARVNAFKVIGQVRDLDEVAQTFRIGALVIDYSVARLDDLNGLANDMVVEVKDDNRAYNPGDFRLIATKVEAAGLGAGDDDGLGFVKIEGLVTQVIDDVQFRMADVVVIHNASTQFVFGDATLVTVGTKLSVEGRRAEDGSLTASKIKFSRNSARVHGVLENIDLDTQSLAIFGISIDASAVARLRDKRDDVEPFSLSDLLPGDFLEVRGNSANNLVVANRIEREDADDTRLRGPAQDVDVAARTLSILGVAITTSAATEYEGLDEAPMTADAFFTALADGQSLVSAKWRDTVTDSGVAVRTLSLED